MEKFCVYILYSEKCDKYYVGHTGFLDQRLQEHNSGKGGTFSSKYMPWVLVYKEIYDDRSVARQREKEIKMKKSRRYIEWLIQNSD